MRTVWAICCIAGLGLAGCGTDAESDPAPTPEVEEESNELNCGGPTSAERYYDGISKVSESGRYTVTLVASDPAPPSKGDNVVTVQVTQNDTPIDDMKVEVAPFMPHHDHGTAPARYDGVLLDTGDLFEVPPFYLFMPGYWEYTVTLTGADGDTDQAVFAFCVDG